MKHVKPRDRTVDVIKGMAILLVVVGHAIQSTYLDFDSNFIFRFIYASHMPLFMFISGYAAGFSAGSDRGVGIYKKFLALMVPFISWYAVAYLINQSWNTVGLKAYVARVIISPDWGLWFLPVLFSCFVLLAAGKKFEPKFGATIYLVIWVGLQLIPTGAFGLDLIKWHFAFFIVGYLAKSLFKLSEIKISPLLCTAIGGAYSGMVLLWWRTMTAIDLSLLRFIPIPGGDLTHPVLVNLFKYFVALLGIFFWWAVTQQISGFKAARVLAYLGLFTMDIYVCHLYFFKLSPGSELARAVLSVVFGVILPLVLSYLLLRRFKTLNKLFLGNRPLDDFKRLKSGLRS